MKQIDRDRLIGCIVLVCAGILFVPAIMTPQQKEIKNPNIIVEKDNESNTNQITNQVATNPSASNQIKLESDDTKSTPLKRNKGSLTVNSSAKKINPAPPKKRNKEIYLRVGSFSKIENANKEMDKLKLKNIPVKIQKGTVKDKVYHRVLVGPYGSDKDVTKAKDNLKKLGYTSDQLK